MANRFNVYLFRNSITSKVLVSPYFRMRDAILNQIAEHRPQLRIRPDHWVPFAVLSGLASLEQAEQLAKRVSVRHKHHSGYYTLPLAPSPSVATEHTVTQDATKEILPFSSTQTGQQFFGWKVPEHVSWTVKRLCKELATSARSPKPAYTAANPECGLELYWERDEYKGAPDSPSSLDWPEGVDHKPLRLLRNRYPLVPGYSAKHRCDEYDMPIAPRPFDRLIDYPRPIFRKLVPTTESSQYSGKTWSRMKRLRKNVPPAPQPRSREL